MSFGITSFMIQDLYEHELIRFDAIFGQTRGFHIVLPGWGRTHGQSAKGKVQCCQI
jgi:hypothetical protein